METPTELFCTVSLLVSWFLGKISKNLSWFNNYLIPVQNLLIGICMAFAEWLLTRDFKVAIAVSGITAGGIYDVLHNVNIILKMVMKKEENYE